MHYALSTYTELYKQTRTFAQLQMCFVFYFILFEWQKQIVSTIPTMLSVRNIDW